MFFYSKAAVERAMKIQEVLLPAMARKITWWQAAEILAFANATKILAMKVCSTGDARSPRGCPSLRGKGASSLSREAFRFACAAFSPDAARAA